MSRPIHLPTRSGFSAALRNGSPLLFRTFAVMALMAIMPTVMGADITFNTYTAGETVAGSGAMNQAGGWLNALIRFAGTYGFLLVIVIGLCSSLWGFTNGNSKAAGWTGLVAAALGALYKAIVQYV